MKLQKELEQPAPIPKDDLEQAADMLENFAKHGDAYYGDIEIQHQLIKLIVERVYVADDSVVAMTLRADYHVVLVHNANGSTEIWIDPFVSMSGDDGCRLPTCKYSLLLLPPYSPANPIFASLLHKLAKAKGLLTSKPFELEAFQRHFA